jgi:uncharacterized protein (DUF305 family)
VSEDASAAGTRSAIVVGVRHPEEQELESEEHEPEADGGAGDLGVGATDTDDVEPEDAPPSGLSWPRVAVLGIALAFLGFALAVFVQRDTSPGADSVDVGFLQDMISHHEQAIVLSGLEQTNGSDLTVRAYATEVLIFQSQEIGMMDQMLHEWGFSRADRSDEAMAWMGMTPVPVDEMLGIIPEERVDELQQARGADADGLFLELMAEHHVGGLHMAEYTAEHADDHDVRRLAMRMARTQAIEINEYAMTAERLDLPVTIERVTVPEYPELDDEPNH